MKLLVATRSAHKLGEIRAILRSAKDLRLLDLNDVGVPYAPEEEGIEVYQDFSENALAKARYFSERTGLPTVADDSGLVVDALGGRPGVHSKRFAPGGEGRSGQEQDRANNEHLLTLLGETPLAERTARYVCVAALVERDREPILVRGDAEGLILGHARGYGGFGYDPLFYDPALGKTFAELTPREKDERSHRGAAFRRLAEVWPGPGEDR